MNSDWLDIVFGTEFCPGAQTRYAGILLINTKPGLNYSASVPGYTIRAARESKSECFRVRLQRSDDEHHPDRIERMASVHQFVSSIARDPALTQQQMPMRPAIASAPVPASPKGTRPASQGGKFGICACAPRLVRRSSP